VNAVTTHVSLVNGNFEDSRLWVSIPIWQESCPQGEPTQYLFPAESCIIHYLCTFLGNYFSPQAGGTSKPTPAAAEHWTVAYAYMLQFQHDSQPIQCAQAKADSCKHGQQRQQKTTPHTQHNTTPSTCDRTSSVRLGCHQCIMMMHCLPATVYTNVSVPVLHGVPGSPFKLLGSRFAG
jgi:hypothetical protein